MKTLILEPSYSKFHAEFALKISTEVYQFIFDIGYILYAPKEIEKIIISSKLREFNTVAFENYLKDFLNEHKIELVLMHNDERWQHKIAISVCKKMDIQYLVTERGLFRPDTTTVDSSGVNANSKLAKMRIPQRELTDYPTWRSYNIKSANILRLYFIFCLFIVVSKMGSIVKCNYGDGHKKFSLRGYLKIFLNKLLVKRTSQLPPDIGPYIFIPLQLDNDSQIQVHSHFKNMTEFLNKVTADFKSCCEQRKIKLVVKEHPMYDGKSRYLDPTFLTTEADTKTLIDNALAVITVNSTVGLEALVSERPVFHYGNAIYQGIEMASSYADVTPEKFIDEIIQPNSEKANVTKMQIAFLKYEYQWNVNLFHYSNDDISRIATLYKCKN